MMPAPKLEPAIDLENSEDRFLNVGRDVEWFCRLKRVLGLPSNRLVYCAGGSTAEVFLKSDIRYDLFLFDFDLPDEMRMELVHLVRSLSHRKQTPIIVVASDVTDGLKQLSRKDEVDECLTKTGDISVAAKTIQSQLRRVRKTAAG